MVDYHFAMSYIHALLNDRVSLLVKDACGDAESLYSTIGKFKRHFDD